jgi:hypothetical protein
MVFAGFKVRIYVLMYLEDILGSGIFKNVLIHEICHVFGVV